MNIMDEIMTGKMHFKTRMMGELIQGPPEWSGQLAEYIENEIQPNLYCWNKVGDWPIRRIFRDLGRMGVLGLTKPPEVGGRNAGYFEQYLFARQLGNIGIGGIPLCVGVQTDMATPAIDIFGSKWLKEEILVPSIRGDSIGCIALTERGGASDFNNIKTTVQVGKNDLIVNGVKTWITNGMVADWAAVLCISDKREFILLVVPMGLNGIERRPAPRIRGNRLANCATISFNNVRVPNKFVVGEIGEGVKYQMHQSGGERLFIAASNLLPIWRLLSIGFQRMIAEMDSDGRALKSKQALRISFAKILMELHAAEGLVKMAAEEIMLQQLYQYFAPMAKAKVAAVAKEVVRFVKQISGACGFIEGTREMEICDDLEQISIIGGASEIMFELCFKGWAKESLHKSHCAVPDWGDAGRQLSP